MWNKLFCGDTRELSTLFAIVEVHRIYEVIWEAAG